MQGIVANPPHEALKFMRKLIYATMEIELPKLKLKINFKDLAVLVKAVFQGVILWGLCN